MIEPLQTATAGLIAASHRFGESAERISQIGTATSALPEATRVDLSGAAMELLGAEAGFSVNLALMASSMRMERQVLDLLV